MVCLNIVLNLSSDKSKKRLLKASTNESSENPDIKQMKTFTKKTNTITSDCSGSRRLTIVTSEIKLKPKTSRRSFCILLMDCKV